MKERWQVIIKDGKETVGLIVRIMELATGEIRQFASDFLFQ